MTASQIAQHFSARKIGKGKWLAKCTAHPDKKPSLTIMEGKRGVLLSCMSQHCNFLDIVRTAGLKPMMLSAEYDPNWKATDKVLGEFYARRSLMLLYDAEVRRQDLLLWLTSLECKWKPVRTPDRFERDIKTYANRICH